MGGLGSRGSAERFASYLDGLVRVIGHAAWVGPMRDYCSGLLPCERKSVEPMAAVTAPGRVGAQHQALLHFVAEGVWSDEANCQTAVSLSIANSHASLPVAYRLYLQKSWAEDKQRCRKGDVPDGIAFKTKHKITLDQLVWAYACGLPRGVVLMDSAYGTDASLRRGTRELGLDYLAAIYARTLIEGSKGKMTAEALAVRLPKRAWRTITLMRWRVVPKARFQHDERDYQELKQEVGLGHFEGRGWRGFHHHATMCIAAYGFLISERGAISALASALRELPPATCRSHGLATQRRRRCGLSDTSPTPSPAYGTNAWPASHVLCRDVRAVRCHAPGKRP